MGKVNKVIVIGTGFVGSSYAYALAIQAIADEIVLIDVNDKKAEGEVMDLNHGLIFYDSPVKIWKGDFSDCKDADIVCLTAGISQEMEEDRLTGIEKNTEIAKNIVHHVLESGFDGIFLIASNPVDIVTYAVWKHSNFPTHKVIGSGTILDTARFQYKLGEYFKVDPRSIIGYVVGEHGDSQVAAISSVSVGGRPVSKMIEENEEYDFEDLEKIARHVRDVADIVVDYKNATYYGIGASLARLTKAILKDENTILPVSAYLNGHYGHEDIYIGVPAIINRQGMREIIEIELNNDEKVKFNESVQLMKHYKDKVFKKE